MPDKIEIKIDNDKTFRESCLTKAKMCVCGERDEAYGVPEDNFNRVADLWNLYTGGKSDILITPKDVSVMMILFKVARIMENGGTPDCFVDIAGYAACGYEILGKERSKKNGNKKEASE